MHLNWIVFPLLILQVETIQALKLRYPQSEYSEVAHAVLTKVREVADDDTRGVLYRRESMEDTGQQGKQTEGQGQTSSPQLQPCPSRLGRRDPPLPPPPLLQSLPIDKAAKRVLPPEVLRVISSKHVLGKSYGTPLKKYLELHGWGQIMRDVFAFYVRYLHFMRERYLRAGHWGDSGRREFRDYLTKTRTHFPEAAFSEIDAMMSQGRSLNHQEFAFFLHRHELDTLGPRVKEELMKQQSGEWNRFAGRWGIFEIYRRRFIDYVKSIQSVESYRQALRDNGRSWEKIKPLGGEDNTQRFLGMQNHIRQVALGAVMEYLVAMHGEKFPNVRREEYLPKIPLEDFRRFAPGETYRARPPMLKPPLDEAQPRSRKMKQWLGKVWKERFSRTSPR